MKRILLVLPVFILGIFVTGKPLHAAEISDIGQHRNQTAINYLLENQIVQGYDDGTFRPDAGINRAEFTKIIVEANYDETTIEKCLPEQMKAGWTYTFFPDVNRNAWFAKYICVAKIKGLIKGYSDGTFKPENPLNKAEAIKILVASQGYSLPKSVESPLYSDVIGNEWFAPYIKAALDHNLLEDTGSSSLGVNAALTRAGMSEMTYRAILAQGGEFETPSESSKISEQDPEKAREQIIDLLISLADDSETDLSSSQLAVLDTPEQNYLYNAKLARTARIEERVREAEPEKWGQTEEEVRAHEEDFEMSLNSTRALMRLDYALEKDDMMYYADDETAYVGSLMTDETTDISFFTCYPFVYDGYWKLKLAHRFQGPADFETPGLIESCSQGINLEPKLQSDDLMPAYLTHATTFASRTYLNGYLLKDTSGYSYSGSSNYLPLKKGTNILMVEMSTDKSYDEKYSGGGVMNLEEFLQLTRLSPNEMKVEITVDGDLLVEFEMDKLDGRASKTFEYEP